MENGYILYQGPSLLNGENIVVIATGFITGSGNRKTGMMVQTYILGTESEPHVAVANGTDDTICGDCVHRGDKATGRGRSCYVQVGQGPLNVYRAWKRGRYPLMLDMSPFANRKVRFGAYGDPAAAPAKLWSDIAKLSDGCTGYTHQWRTKDLADTCMASVDSVEEAEEASALGYRTFRVTLEQQDKNRLSHEVVCPASEEAGKKLMCFQCMACNGNVKNTKSGIVINVHGNGAHRSNARKIPIAIAA